MKTFAAGALFGAILSLSTAAYASDTIQALLFPAQLELNGQRVASENGQPLLNVNGSAYVPLRFVAEQLGAVVGYDEQEQRIIVKNEALLLHDPAYPAVSVGNVIAAPSASNGATQVIGQLMVQDAHPGFTMIGASLSFYNDQGELLDEVSITGTRYGGEPVTFETASDKDLRGYTSVQLHVHAVDYRYVNSANQPPMIITEDRATEIAKAHNSADEPASYAAVFYPSWSDSGSTLRTSVWVVTAAYPQGNRQITVIQAETGNILADGDAEAGGL